MNIEAVAYDFTISWKWDSILFRKKFADGILFCHWREAQQQQRYS